MKKLIKKSRGQGSIEYAVLIALISIVVISSLVLLSGEYVNGKCIVDPESDKLIGSHVYIKNDDTGITSIIRNVTCVIGGWKDSGEDEGEAEGDFTPGDESENDYNYTLSAKEAEEAGFKFSWLSGYSKITSFSGKLDDGNKLVIPNAIIDDDGQHIKVESIGWFAFYNKDIKHLVIPESVENISFAAFLNNPNLESVEVMGENTSANRYAFPGSLGMRGDLKRGIYKVSE